MKIEEAIDNLKEYINVSYEKTKAKVGPRILRGHLRSLSTDIEDGIALFVSELMPDSKIFADASVHVGGKNNRPDILVLDRENRVQAMIEIKSNMGWCRNAKGVIDDIVANDDAFKKEKSLVCEFSEEPSQAAIYGDGVKLFLIALTDTNCGPKHHAENKEYAKSAGVYQFNLFSGWYGGLTDCEAKDFAEKLIK